MSRTTQYIGLNEYALAWVNNSLCEAEYEMTHGIGDEPVYGAIYHMPPPDGPNKALIAKEVVQHEVWSSGPMIFTHLEITLVKESGQEIPMGYYFSWMTDPSLSCEYDFETGRVYI